MVLHIELLYCFMVLLRCLTVWTTFYFGEWRNAAWLSEKYQLYCSVEEKKVVSDMNVYKQWQSFHFWVDCFKSSVDQSQAPWGCNSGWSGHLIPSTGVVAGLLHMTPTGNSLYCCDLQTQPHTSGSVTIKKTSRNLLASYIQKIIIFMFKCFYLNYKFQMTLYYVHPLSWKKQNKTHTVQWSYYQVESTYSAVPWASIQQSVMDLHSIHGLLMAFKVSFCRHLLPWIWYIW